MVLLGPSLALDLALALVLGSAVHPEMAEMTATQSWHF